MSFVEDAIKDTVDFIGDALEDIAGAVVDGIQFVWGEITMPILEEVFSWFGIEDEFVVTAKKISVKLFDDTQDNYRDALVRGVLANIKNDASFYENYMYEVNRNKAQIRAQYAYIRNGRHTHGLPQMTISGGSVNLTQVGDTLDIVKGGSNTVLNVESYRPSDYLYFQDQLQQAPELYKPYSNTLTYDNQYGQSFNDWSFVSALYNASGPNYDLTISRSSELAVFWLEGGTSVVEGNSAEFTVKCNREIPAGKTATITLAYAGTAVDGADYTSLATVDIVAGTSETVFYIPTLENAVVNGSRTLEVSANSVDNSAQIFESVLISPAENSVTVSVIDDDSVILTMSNVRVSEDATTVTIPVKLEAATSAFTADFVLSNITAIKGVDYEDVTDTLSFAGAEGEIQNIVIGITADVVDDDYEQFLVALTNCTNPAVDITQTSIVTIIDGTDTKYPPRSTTDSVVFTKPDYSQEKTLIVKYHNDSDPSSEWYYWLYRYVDDTYPLLNETADRISNLEMLPTVMIRNDKVNINSDKTSAGYKSTRNLLRFMGIEVDNFVDMITANPDIEAVDDAFIYFGINPLDNNPAISRMMYLMWEEIMVKYNISSNTQKFHASYDVGDMIKNSVVWTGQTMEDIVEASSMKVGTYSHEIVGGSNLVITYRVNSTTSRVITVENLSSISLVSATIDGQLYNKAVPNTLSDADFTLPVSWYVLNSLTSKEIAQVFPFMLRVEFYAATGTEIAWYQTEEFIIVLRVIQIVLTIFFWYIDGGTSLQLAFELITQYAIGEFVAIGVEAVLKITGNKELAVAFGVIASVALSSRGDFNIDFTDPVMLLEMSTLFASNMTRVYDSLNRQQVDRLEALDAEYEDRQEDIDAANKSLTNGVTAEYITYLNSVDTNLEMAIGAQFNYSYTYNYDSLIENFFDDKLKAGVI